MQAEERELSPIRLGSIAAFHLRFQPVDATHSLNFLPASKIVTFFVVGH